MDTQFIKRWAPIWLYTLKTMNKTKIKHRTQNFDLGFYREYIGKQQFNAKTLIKLQDCTLADIIDSISAGINLGSSAICRLEQSSDFCGMFVQPTAHNCRWR